MFDARKQKLDFDNASVNCERTMTPLDWFNISGTFATWVGLFVSVGALFYAKSAAKRAEEARDAVEKHYIRDAWRRATEQIRQIEEAIRRDDRTLAITYAADLKSHIIQMTARYRSKLSRDSIDKLVSAKSQLRSIVENLQSATGTMKDEEKLHLLIWVDFVKDQMDAGFGDASAIEQMERSG